MPTHVVATLREQSIVLQVHGSPVQGDSLTTVAADSLDTEPAAQTPDYAQLAKDLDKKSPLEIMDHVRTCINNWWQVLA